MSMLIRIREPGKTGSLISLWICRLQTNFLILGVFGVIDPRKNWTTKVHPKYVKCWGVQIKDTKILIFFHRHLIWTMLWLMKWFIRKRHVCLYAIFLYGFYLNYQITVLAFLLPAWCVKYKVYLEREAEKTNSNCNVEINQYKVPIRTFDATHVPGLQIFSAMPVL